MTKTYFEDLGKIAESNAKSAQQSARIATEYWVASRERNNELARAITRTITEGMKRQTDANEELTSRIFEMLEERAEAFTSVPFDYTQQTTREAEMSANSGITMSANWGFPIAGYDELSVEEISGWLDTLTEAQIKQVRDHERRTKNRKSLMDQF